MAVEMKENNEKKIELPGAITQNIGFFTGRTWLLPHIGRWLAESGKRIFILTGEPGTGKSMVMAWLAGYGPMPGNPAAQKQLEEIRSQVKAIHFCAAASGSTAPKALARNMAEQLTRNVRGFGDVLANVLADQVRITVEQKLGMLAAGGSVTGVHIERLELAGLSEELSFNRVLREPLQELYDGKYDDPMLLLIDALDEAVTYTGAIDIVRLLAKLDDLPKQVRFLVSTRPDPRVLKYFHKMEPFDLIDKAPSGVDDVRFYAAERLTALDDDSVKSALTANIARAAAGNFLYAFLFVNDILTRSSHETDFEAIKLPKDLGGIFSDFLNRELGADENTWHNVYQPLLGLIAIAQGTGLTRKQLESITETNVEHPIRVCKQYLDGRLPNGPFRLFHKSFTDFLLSDESNIDYHIDAKVMHSKLVGFYLYSYADSWSNCDDYGLTYLIGHALAADIDAKERAEVFDRILTDGYMQALLDRSGWHMPFLEDLRLVAKVDSQRAAGLCLKIIEGNRPNSLVLQNTLRLLVKLRSTSGRIGKAQSSTHRAIDAVTRILAESPPDANIELAELLKQVKNPRVKGVIALSLGETGSRQAVPDLLNMLRTARRQGSWAAADALIALNDPAIISDLVTWYKETKSAADKERILYILGWMHAEDARTIQPDALNSTRAKIVGRAIDLMWLLQPAEGDDTYLLEKLEFILKSDPHKSKMLGVWEDEWLQKRLVRALGRTGVAQAIGSLKNLQEHVDSRRDTKHTIKRKNLEESTKDAIRDLESGERPERLFDGV